MMAQSMPSKLSDGSGPSRGSSDRNRTAAGVARRSSARRMYLSDSIDVPSQTFGSGQPQRPPG